MSREDKKLELAIGAILLRINEMKMSLVTLLHKIEQDSSHVNMPVFLDAFSVISGQMNTLVRLLKSENMPVLKSLIVLPLALSQEKDTNLISSTEGRLVCCNHEVVPDYLRTKPDPEVESRHGAVELRASQANQDNIAKQIAQMNKMSNHLFEIISQARDEWEATEKVSLPTTYSKAETAELVLSINDGKPFKPTPIVASSRSSVPQGSASTSQGVTKSAPTRGIKTNIRRK